MKCHYFSYHQTRSDTKQYCHNVTYWLLVTGLLFSGVHRFSVSLFPLRLWMVLLLLLTNISCPYRTATINIQIQTKPYCKIQNTNFIKVFFTFISESHYFMVYTNNFIYATM